MGYLMGVPFRDALLVSAGMGWYSLSSVLLSAAVGTETGTLAFLANALRELLTILGIPLLARFCHLPLVVVGGATSMDSTMPILLQWAFFFITVRSITITNGFLIYGGSGPKGFG